MITASLRMRRRTRARVELVNGRATRWVGGLIAIAALVACVGMLPWSRSVAIAAAVAGLVGVAVASEQRQFVFDRGDGVLRRTTRIFGITHKETVPLFHLRDVVLTASRDHGGNRYVLYLRRRVGDTILLGEATTCASLLRMAEAIAEIAEIRLEYDATARRARS